MQGLALSGVEDSHMCKIMPTHGGKGVTALSGTVSGTLPLDGTIVEAIFHKILRG